MHIDFMDITFDNPNRLGLISYIFLENFDLIRWYTMCVLGYPYDFSISFDVPYMLSNLSFNDVLLVTEAEKNQVEI